MAFSHHPSNFGLNRLATFWDSRFVINFHSINSFFLGLWTNNGALVQDEDEEEDYDCVDGTRRSGTTWSAWYLKELSPAPAISQPHNRSRLWPRRAGDYVNQVLCLHEVSFIAMQMVHIFQHSFFIWMRILHDIQYRITTILGNCYARCKFLHILLFRSMHMQYIRIYLNRMNGWDGSLVPEM